MNDASIPLPGRTDLAYWSVENAVGAAQFALMPYTSRVLAENILRKCPAEFRAAALALVAQRNRDADFPFFPARVILQDLLGTPALVDLAGMRDAVADAGGDPSIVNPKVPTHLVVDHSLNVEVSGSTSDAMEQNMVIEQRKNAERFEFLAWCKKAFTNLDVLMPGNGILHQVNLEYFSPGVQNTDGVAYPDTLVGTDSHTTMINALGVLGWGVGGIEAESVMLGRPIWMRLPQIVAVELSGSRPAGVMATDVVLAITEFLRTQKVVGAILEFCGPGAAALSLNDRATISNMAPEFGATAAIFAIDDNTLNFLRLTGRKEETVALVGAYAKAQGLWADALVNAEYDRKLAFDLNTVTRSLAGPANPHQRVPLSTLKAAGVAGPITKRAPTTPTLAEPLDDGAIVIAAITSCTNTSNPRSVIAAGLLARNALAKGLSRKPWVKTSLAPGSKAVERYLAAADLIRPLQQLGFGIIGFGCTSCNGMSGPLDADIEADIVSNNVKAVAVLSGNRNFNGRIHPRVKEAFLASPALVVAYAIAGTIRVDIENEPIGVDTQGNPVSLADVWPSDDAIDEVLAAHVHKNHFTEVYAAMFGEQTIALDPSAASVPLQFAWRSDSTYIQRPPYWAPELTTAATFTKMRALAVLGDNITTDDLSPSGAILKDSAAGEYLTHHGVTPPDFNSYGTRRGNHVAAIRATFANNQLRNEMTPGVMGSVTRLEPDGNVMRLFEAAEVYMERGQELIVVAGKNYGAGSSRDWAAKGVRLVGVRAVVCENFERIHRSNLVGMGVLPLEFEAGTTRKTLNLDGSELYSLPGVDGVPAPGSTLTLRIERKDGAAVSVPVTCRIDTDEEVQVFEAGGLLQRISREFLETA